MKKFLITLFAVAGGAFRDLLRERILYNLFFVSLFLLFFGYLAALLVFGHQDRVMLHMGSLVIALSIYSVAASAGARVIRNELEQRTAYLTLARPVSRVAYYFGKWLGIGAFSCLNLALLGVVLLIGLRVTGGHPNLALLQSFALLWVEGLLIVAFALWVSLWMKQGMTVMICVAYFFLAHNHEQLDMLNQESATQNSAFHLLNAITPNAQALLLDTRAYYGISLSSGDFAQRMAYGLAWAVFFLLIGNAQFYRKNL